MWRQKCLTDKIRVLAVAALILLSLIIGCRSGTGDRKTIGVVGPFTGDGATYGASMRRGIELAVAGRADINLVLEDTKLDPKEGVNAIQKLVARDKVQVVLGAAASGVTLAMAPVAEKDHVVLFSSISTSDDLKGAGDFIFRNVPRNEIQGTTAAEFIMHELHRERAAILRKNDAYGTNLSESFRQRYGALGGSVVFDEAYNPGENDFRATVTKIKMSHPDVIYVPGNYQEVAVFLVQSKEGGLVGPFVGGDGSYSPILVDIAGTAAEGTYYTMMSVQHNDYYDRFLAAFRDKYHQDPDIYDAYAFEAGKLLLQAIDSAGYDASKIRDYLYGHSFKESLTGPLTFDRMGEVDRRYGIVQVRNGAFVFLENDND